MGAERRDVSVHNNLVRMCSILFGPDFCNHKTQANLPGRAQGNNPSPHEVDGYFHSVTVVEAIDGEWTSYRYLQHTEGIRASSKTFSFLKFTHIISFGRNNAECSRKAHVKLHVLSVADAWFCSPAQFRASG